MVSKESIQQELESILASELFGGKKQAGKFLQYIVNETLEGRGERITQYGIAVEALGKPMDYCPTESPAVRVEAGRVRKLLEEYYATDSEGGQHVCQISLPVGGYTPAFRPIDSARLQWRRLGGKRVQSSGPKIYIACQNPASIRDDRLRNIIYKIRSSMPVMLGKLGTVQIALADPGFAFSYADHALEYAWRQHQAEFLLYSEAVLQSETPKLRYVLIHTLSREVVWSTEFMLTDGEQLLDEMYARLVNEVFSLYQGVALSFWSDYWYQQADMPEAYQVLAAHVRFLQDEVTEASFNTLWQVCQKRTRQYHDDALAHLHYAVACLYAHLLKADLSESLEDIWQRQTLLALELNPGNALAHAIFALNCYARGESELARVEIEIARKSNPLDIGCERLIATGLCALRAWDKSFRLLKDFSAPTLGPSYPDPLRTVPCLYYFRRGRYIVQAATETGFSDLGGWEQFGQLVNHCRAGECKACVYTLNQVVNRLQPIIGVGLNEYLWEEKKTSTISAEQ